MDANGGGDVIDLGRSKVSIREMLGGAPGLRPGNPPWEHKEEPVPPEAPAEDPEADGLDLALPEAVDPLPKAGDPYVAYARATARPVLTVSFLLKDGTTSRGFSYGTFDSIDRLPGDKPGGGPVIVIRFAGLAPTEVRIEGRNLSTLYAYLGQHRVAWVREQAGQRDFREESATVVSEITITPLA